MTAPRPERGSVTVELTLRTPVDATGNPFLLFWPVGPRDMEIEVIWFALDGLVFKHLVLGSAAESERVLARIRRLVASVAASSR